MKLFSAQFLHQVVHLAIGEDFTIGENHLVQGSGVRDDAGHIFPNIAQICHGHWHIPVPCNDV